MSRPILIGIGEMKISTDPSVVLAAPNLGSCLGISIFDPVKKVGGMIHCLLPLSKSDPEKARSKPYLYVDTGVTSMLEQLFEAGANRKSLEICFAGGAEINEAANSFRIGKKNITVCRKFLWKNNLLIKSQDVGGGSSRTISLAIGTGEVMLKTQGKESKMN